MVQEIWQKFNANERMAAIGAGIVVVAWIIGIASPYGIGASTVALLGAIALLAVLYLKYAPNQNINWPAPIPVLLLAISGIVALIAVVTLLQWLSLLGGSSITLLLSLLGTVVGAGMMAWYSYQEWQSSQAAA
ncbi:MAG: hypothetical protein E6I45_08050 [Chloroflexi bacterium]|nr:MAG: hypothetical protein E6I45_08050 [Chloroflexota bacterium]